MLRRICVAAAPGSRLIFLSTRYASAGSTAAVATLERRRPIRRQFSAVSAAADFWDDAV